MGRRRGGFVRRADRRVRLLHPADRQRSVARPARWRQLVGEGPGGRHHRTVGRRHPREGVGVGHGHHRGGRPGPAAPAPAARPARARRPERSRHDARAQRRQARPERAEPVGGVAAARLPAAPGGPAQPRRRHHQPHQPGRRRGRGARGLRRRRGGGALRDARVRPGSGRARHLARDLPPRHRRHGPAQPRAVHLRRRLGHGLPPPRRAHHAGRDLARPPRPRGRRARWLRRSRRPPVEELAELRRLLSEVAGRPMVVQRDTSAVARRFAARPDVASLATVRPAHPRPRDPHQAGGPGGS